jgi:hypothetical protein
MESERSKLHNISDILSEVRNKKQESDQTGFSRSLHVQANSAVVPMFRVATAGSS